ncbi:MAG: D-glycero-beta-D-manno-heptose 1-phosphate adenylyltransferase [Elusimicrobiales bacterium]|nr:D-glycero-beta-D-manno-heptose 1-phosphate adenylyltransferase [Elusimicrobiales bacterium]MCK5582785.1 D-glycero-beta-D-manno-heptose 1-phosphate adenylyltransferase [Elusimicrobiales bacterium]
MSYKKKTLSLSKLIKFLKEVKKTKKKIVFTNGCFDIIHSGHISLLEKAKDLGDILIVGLNADSSVKKLKGNARPINKEKDRAVILSAMEMVDKVIIFKEDTPYEILKVIKPDILVKGADYTHSKIVGTEFAKKTARIKLVKGQSTSGIIKKLHTSA